MTIERTRIKHPITGKQLSPETLAKDVLFDSGKDLESLYGEIEGDIFSPTIVQESAMAKLGEGVNVDVSQNVQDGAFKSAILKGCTLVNYFKPLDDVESGGSICGFQDGKIVFQFGDENSIWGNSYTAGNVRLTNSLKVSPNTKYFAKLILSKPVDGTVQFGNFKESEFSTSDTITIANNGTNIYQTIVTTGTDTDYIGVIISHSVAEIVYGELLVIPYQDGMENWDIPYFEGMQSVRMPVLTTTGSNLLEWRSIFDREPVEGYITNKGTFFKPVFITVPNVNEQYTFVYSGQVDTFGSDSGFMKAFAVTVFYTDGTSTQKYATNENVLLSTRKGKIIDRVEIAHPFATSKPDYTARIKDIAMYKGVVNKQFEPHKSNILTCLEPVELGGIGDVKDTLDVLTGEVVESTKKVTFNGNEEWTYLAEIYDGKFRYNLTVGDIKPSSSFATNLICDKLPAVPFYQITAGNYGISMHDSVKIITVVSDISNINDFKQFINGVTVRYPIEKVVKTVDLSGRLWGYKGGHLQISNGFEGKMTYNNGFIFPYEVNISKVTTIDGVEVSISNIENNGTPVITLPVCTNATDYIVTCKPVQSLLPTIEYQVATSRTGQITQNTNVLMEHDKKIYSLEMMLMSSSVEDAYQRYLLQNDVQVVRFNADAEGSNPMRYYMLSRLIEENAYEEIDMLDKLDTFFMYNEITTDQYFELMDIVLGLHIDEDVIVEA